MSDCKNLKLSATDKLFPEVPILTDSELSDDEDESDTEMDTDKAEECFSGLPTGGLKGGARDSHKQNKMGLKLINNKSSGTRNICFVNAAVQLFKCTGFATFLMTELRPLLGNHPLDYAKGCRALVNLYSEKTARERSAVLVRKCVAQHTGKSYLNDGSQQDAEEFLSSLVSMISTELENYSLP